MPQDYGEERQGDHFTKSFSGTSHPSFPNDGGGAGGDLGCHGPWIMLIPVNQHCRGSTGVLQIPSCLPSCGAVP